MPSPLEHVAAGQALSAGHQNALIDRLNAVSRFSAGGALTAGHGSGGLGVSAPDRVRLAIWQLTGPMQRATTNGIPDDVPSAPAVPVWYFPVDGTAPENRYQAAPECSRADRLYFVAGLPGDQRSQLMELLPGQPGDVAIPRFAPGDWVLARFNNQSGRWEILEGPETLWRFELKTPLQPNGDRDRPSIATAYLVVFDPQQGEYIRTNVEFPVADFLDIAQGEPGDRGYARRLADSHLAAGWEVLVLKSESSSSSEDGSSSGEDSHRSSSSTGQETELEIFTSPLQRLGNYLQIARKKLVFVDGRLVTVHSLQPVSVYLCCDGSGSGGGQPSEPSEPSQPLSSQPPSSEDCYPEQLCVSGNLVPEAAKGTYHKTGQLNDRPQWSKGDWLIDWDRCGQDQKWYWWVHKPGQYPDQYSWRKPDSECPQGEYEPYDGTSGNAIVSTGPCATSSEPPSSEPPSSQPTSSEPPTSATVYTIFYRCEDWTGPYHATGEYYGVWYSNAGLCRAFYTSVIPEGYPIDVWWFYGLECPSSSEASSSEPPSSEPPSSEPSSSEETYTIFYNCHTFQGPYWAQGSYFGVWYTSAGLCFAAYSSPTPEGTSINVWNFYGLECPSSSEPLSSEPLSSEPSYEESSSSEWL
ncbi:MAG: hypothetical protein NZ602_14235 [Thermoguttaceae bacterium]|nr:hypothetical protein [Thermoguttaceae bacterium]MDW8039607.1 hypothetical protein [Thermoguttaceae bacterium]